MKRISFIAIWMVLSFLAAPVFGEEEKEDVTPLPEVVVTDKFEEEDFVGPLFTETNTKTKMTEKGIEAMGTSVQMSVPKAITLIPSVNQQSVDPFGLADISNYHESFRFRGIEPTGGGNPSTPTNVENVPVTGRPGGGANIFDLENFRSIAIYKGGVPADKGFGLTNIGGKIDMEVKRSGTEFSFNLKQALGTHNFRRTFARLDSGAISSGTSGFLSYSNTFGDKWKGEGDANRNNAMVGVTQKIGEGLNIEAFSIYNKAEINTYRPLNYRQTTSLGKNYNFDYTDNSSDYFYYGYNKNDFQDYNIFANIEYSFDNNSSISVKPFYWKDDGYYLETITMKNGKNRVRRWDIDHDLTGVLTQYSLEMASAGLNVGYFYLEQERPGPPTSWKLYKVGDTGLTFDKWQLLSNTSEHRQHMPFVSGKYAVGSFKFEGGIKYLRYEMPQVTTYNTTGIGDVSYNSALGMATSVDADACAASKDFNKILPNFGVSYMITDSLSTYFSYGRNYGISVALYPYFISQKSAFRAKGITLQDLWDTQEMEIADNFDLGLRYITEKLYVVPTIYYGKHTNKAATYYDDSLGVTFPATVFDADAYGFELEAGLLPIRNLSLYGSFSYNRFYFSQDIYGSSGNTIAIDGNQVPDAPEFLVKGILSYDIADFTLSPVIRYTSSRYGDILHEEKIDGVVLFDFNVTYTTAFPSIKMKELAVSLSFTNIFNKEYIGIINTADYKTLGSSYETGAPFTVFASASISF